MKTGKEGVDQLSNQKQQNVMGGFVAVNAGKIVDCYSTTSVKGRGLLGGFTASNTESVEKSYCLGKVSGKGKKGRLFGQNTGDISEGFAIVSDSFVNKDPDNDSYYCKESELSQRLKDGNWNMEEIWTLSDSEYPKFQEDFWWAELSYDSEAIHISTAKELNEIAAKIESGDKQAASAVYVLDNDIDLKGKKWTPIGSDILPFTGIMNGNGHEIRNFKVKNKKTGLGGLFGYLNGTVVNLGVDGIIKGGHMNGGLAAVVSQEAMIACCYSKCSISSAGLAGGLVGKNFGNIMRSFSAGQVRKIFPWPWILGGLLFALLAALLLLWYFKPGLYPAIPVDQNARQVEEANPASGGNHVTYQFNDEAVFPSNSQNGEFYIKNPGDSNHDIVVEFYITDQELLNTVGTTGRSAEEQQQLESSGNYSPDSQRTLIAESGSIPPGYELDVIRLKSLPDGTELSAGSYQVIAQLVFYDLDTHERAMVNSEIPTTLIIES